MRISGLACFLLIALRLVIGWHFLVEGYYKIRTHQIGKTSTNTPWSSEPFFREAHGPIADWYRDQLDLSDDTPLERIKSFRDVEWDDYVDRLSKHYDLDADQRAAVESKLSEFKRALKSWRDDDSKSEVAMPTVWGTVEVRQSVSARLAEFDAKKKQIREIQESEQTAFNDGVGAARLRALKTESAKILNELLADLRSRTDAMKAAVIESAKLTVSQKAKGPLLEPSASLRKIDRVNTATMWMQAILGGFLLIGLFTRLSSFLLAGFLLQVVLLMPALPAAPTAPGEMGHYLYVDLHVIEMVALLVLAAIPTGKWFGMDALFGKRGASSAAK